MSSTVPASAEALPSSLTLPFRPADALPVYLDYNATTPLSEPVVAAMQPFLQAGVGGTLFGNPSSSHVYGSSAKSVLEQARTDVASMINAASPGEIVLMSGATESLNSALQGSAYSQRARGLGNHIISCAIEHIATLQILQALSRDGFDVTILPVDREGRVSPEQVAAAVRPTTVLVSLMLANNETGAVLPIAAVASAVRAAAAAHGRDPSTVWLHTDASQALGKMFVDVRALDVDLLTVAGHKIYASKGVGALYVRDASVRAQGGLRKFMIGANHESDRRAGTENVQLIAGLGAAARAIVHELPQLIASFERMRDALEQSLRSKLAALLKEHHLDDTYSCDEHVAAAVSTPAISASSSAASSRPAAFVVHCSAPRLSNTLSIGFRDVSATALLQRLRLHVAASAGAACHSDTVSLSYVLQAMGVAPEYGMGTLRLSVGRYNTEAEVREVGTWIAQAVTQLWLEQRVARAAKEQPYHTLDAAAVQ